MSSCQSGKYPGCDTMWPPPPPWKLLAKPWDQIIHDCNRCLIGLMSVAIFNPPFIFRSTRVGGSMSTDKQQDWQRVFLKDISSDDDNLTKLRSTWCQHCLPVHHAVTVAVVLGWLYRPSPGCSGSTNQVPYHKPSYNLAKPLNLRWRIGNRECLFCRK